MSSGAGILSGTTRSSSPGILRRFELSHRAYDRTVFAHGALRAARWVVGKKPGLYGMNDVLDLR